MEGKTYFARRISSAKLDRRWTPMTFHPTYQCHIDRLLDSPFKLKRLTAKDVVIAWGDGDHGSPNFVEQGVPFIQGQHLKNLIADFPGSNIVFITKEKHLALSRSQLAPGDLLVVKKGTIGYVSILPKTIEEANTGAEVGFFRFRPEFDAYFIAAYLSSCYGQSSLLRISHKSTRPTLGLNELDEIFFPCLKRDPQTYIGDKVRLAERLRERSQHLISSAKLLIEALIEGRVTQNELKIAQEALQRGDRDSEKHLIADLNSKRSSELKSFNSNPQGLRIGGSRKHTNRVKSQRVDSQRLDPDYYHPQHLSDEDCLRDVGAEHLGETGRFFAGPFGSELPGSLYLEQGIPLFRVGNVGTMQFEPSGMAYLAPEVHSKLSASEVVPGDLLIVKASVGEKICKVPESMPKANITQHIIAIRPNGKFDIDYIAAFLFCDYGRRQLVRRSLGSIIQYLGINDARTVLFPKIEKSAQIYIGDKVRQGVWAQEQVQLLTTAAKFLVEALIEGKVTEDELKTAQEALQRGDREPDQLILSRLTHKGFDVKDEPPLFPDLDALYEAINQLNADNEEES